MRKVFKYILSEPVIEIPTEAKILKVDYDKFGSLCGWFLVNPEGPKVKRKFEIYGTGEEVDNAAIYCGSVKNHPFIWHVFEVPA